MDLVLDAEVADGGTYRCFVPPGNDAAAAKTVVVRGETKNKYTVNK